MDERLFSASLRGNVDELQRLLDEDPFILLRVASVSAETPLHLASMAGHLDFVKDIVKLMPEFAGELNQDGLSPIHLASAKGHVEIVKELLTTINCDQQCRLESNRDKKTPIHYAAIKGRTDVINELISSCKECLDDVTIRGETALHLAVKNNQFEAFRVMVERLKDLNKEDILNVKDEEGGNTVLHLATSMKQTEVLKLLLLVNDMGTGAVEVNAVNRCNLTALDLLMLLLPNESSDRHIEEILRRAGAKRAEELADENVQVLISSSSNINQATTSSLQADSTRSPLFQLRELFEFQIGKESAANIRDPLLVIAVLITTATYQAVLSPPGGVWQDDDKEQRSPGRSIMGTINPFAFGVFLICNSVGFFSSLFLISILIGRLALRLELYILSVSMIATYQFALIGIVPIGNDGLSIVSTVIGTISMVCILSLMLGERFMGCLSKGLSFRWMGCFSKAQNPKLVRSPSKILTQSPTQSIISLVQSSLKKNQTRLERAFSSPV